MTAGGVVDIGAQAYPRAQREAPLELRRARCRRILREEPQLSDRAIARAVGLSPKTVAAMRRRHGEGPADLRLGADGRVYRFGTERARDAVAAELDRNPTVSVRELARAAGVSIGRAHRLRRALLEAPVPTASARAVPGPVPDGGTAAASASGSAQTAGTAGAEKGPGGAGIGLRPGVSGTAAARMASRADPGAAAGVVPAADRVAPVVRIPLPAQRNPASSGADAPSPRRAPAVEADPGADPFPVNRAVRLLAADPSVRLSERGRSLIRLLVSQAAATHGWPELLDAVPAHQSGAVLALAEDYERMWRQIADGLRRR